MAGDHVFVYGTLRRGGSNSFRMDGAEFVGAATVRGKLYPISWYPGLVLDEAADLVKGEVFRVSAEQLAALDAFEGPEYRRVRTEAITASGERLSAWIWEWAMPVDGGEPIAGGDWLEHSGV